VAIAAGIVTAIDPGLPAEVIAAAVTAAADSILSRAGYCSRWTAAPSQDG
jgi:hypothetical protein